MSGTVFAAIIGTLAMLAAYLMKRVIDYLLPPGRHWRLLDGLSIENGTPQEQEEDGV